MADATAPSRPPAPGRILSALGVDRSEPGPPVAVVADRLGVAVEALAEPLARMAGAGVVAVWADGSGTLRVARVSAGERVERLASRTMRKSIAGRGVVLESELGVGICELADPLAIEPAEALALAEADVELSRAKVVKDVRGRATRLPEKPPKPRIFLGMDLPWTAAPAESCPGCGGASLGPTAYCLLCDRWGLDGAFPTPAADRARKVRDRAAKLAGGVGAAEGGKVDSGPAKGARAKGKRRAG